MWRREPPAPAALAFDRIPAWDDDGLARALAWYREVATSRRPAKYLIAGTVPLAVALDASEESLWSELDRLTPVFLERWGRVRDGAALPSPADPSLLDLVATLGWRMLAHCNFCRWDCRVDRAAGTKVGACRLAAGTRVSTWFHHPGEELVYRGTHGSGTIFFTSCNMRCAFCQNGDISTDKDNGDEVEPRILAAMAWALRAEGCHNVNWVGGEVTIHLHAILEAIRMLGRGFLPTRDDLARAVPTKADRWSWHDRDPRAATFDGRFNAPMLWNSNFFMSADAMRLLRIVTDVWLPDFKFGPGECAMKLARTPWYWETVTGNLRLVRDWGEDLTIRHLVMPAHVDCCTVPVLDWVRAEMPKTPVNVMDQYHPDNWCDPGSPKYRPQYESIARHPRRAEIRAAYAHADRLGLAWQTITHERRVLERFGIMPGV